MQRFVGRDAEIGRLDSLLDKVREGGADPGRTISIRGRRRVGKSRMVREFLRRSGVPHVYFNAEHGATDQELKRFAAEVAHSSLPDRDLFVPGDSWSTALRGLALALPRDQPSVIVIDEVPYLMRDDAGFEGALQGAWDRVLSGLPVLLVLVGSNRAEMERLTSYDRPFYLRGTEMELGPLEPVDVAELTGLSPENAIDAFLITGGLPMILADWKHGCTPRHFLTDAVSDPLSPLLVSGERVLSAELPTEANARDVLSAIGSGETTFASIARTAGLAQSSLDRALTLLTQRRLVVVEQPLSTSPAKNNRYRIEDPYLRFWLRFLRGHIQNIEAGRPDIALADIESSWLAWRGRAVEPVIRDLLWRTPNLVPLTGIVGGWWNRSNSVEVDLVGADQQPGTRQVTFVGSIKWRERKKFDAEDLAALVAARDAVAGAANAPLVAVSRSGFSVQAEELTSITPAALLNRSASLLS